MLNNALARQWLSPTLSKPMPRKPPALADFRRIVVKVGSSLLVDAEAGRVKEAWLAALSDDIARLGLAGNAHIWIQQLAAVGRNGQPSVPPPPAGTVQ